MKLLNVLILLLSITSFSAMAQSGEEEKILPDDKTCRQVYNQAYEDLKEITFDFNDQTIGGAIFTSKVVGIDAYLNSVRAVCFVVESPKNAKCVEAYKKRYKALRREIKITSVLLGNQTSINPDIIETIGHEFSALYYKLKCGDLEI